MVDVLQVEIPSILDLPRILTILTIRLSQTHLAGLSRFVDLGAKHTFCLISRSPRESIVSIARPSTIVRQSKIQVHHYLSLLLLHHPIDQHHESRGSLFCHPLG